MSVFLESFFCDSVNKLWDRNDVNYNPRLLECVNTGSRSLPDELSVFKWFGLILGLCSCLQASPGDMMLSWQGNSHTAPLLVRMR